MKGKYVKELAVLGILTLLGQPRSAYAGWQQQSGEWKYEQAGSLVRESWIKEGDGWYYLEADGRMASGWKQQGGFWYFLNPIPDGTRGKMMTGWQWIDGRCYYFSDISRDGHPMGAMYANGQTPDGYWVETDGAWVDARGEIVEIFGKGIVVKNQALERTPGITGPGGGGGISQGGGGRKGRGGRGSGSKSSSNGSNKSDRGKSIEDQGVSDKSIEDKIVRDKESEDQSVRDKESEDQSRCDKENEDPSCDGKENDRSKEDSSLNKEEQQEGKIPVATDSNVAAVNWYIHFTDQETHQTLLAESRQGRIPDGETLSVNFRERIVDSEGNVWESVEKPPLKLQVYGPEDRIFYVEYRQTGRIPETDPFEEERRRLQKWMDRARKQEVLLTGEEEERIPDDRFVVRDAKENDGRLLTLAGQIRFPGEYAVYVIGKDWEPNGRILKNFYGEELTYSQMVEDRFLCQGGSYTITRFSLSGKESGAEKEDPEDVQTSRRLHWNLGDVLTGELDGERFFFRCIDQNYSDEEGNHRQGALFLCDTVIPADFGSSYTYEALEDGSFGYVFEPGPIVNFGKTNDYKYSRIRDWLKQSEVGFSQAKEISVGVSRAYAGETDDGMYGQFQESDLRGAYIGDQKLTGKLFILSVDEALKYRDWLWRFGDSEEENSQSVSSAHAKGYWLRNPVGTAGEHDTGLVYVVDLMKGKIRPAAICPTEDGADEELRVTGAIGVRPAFVMPQE